MRPGLNFRIGPALFTLALVGLSALLPAESPPAGSAANPATAPATTRPAIGAIDIGDYCTILLAPKLQDKLALSDDQRQSMSDLKTDLKAYLSNAIGNMHTRPTAGLIGARSHTALSMIGKKVRQGITPEQDKTLVGLFDDGTLKTIQVVSSLTNEGPAHGTGSFSVGAVELIYTHYGEKDSAKPNTQHAANQANDTSDVPRTPSKKSRSSSDTDLPDGAAKTEMVGGKGGSPFVHVDPGARPLLGFSFKVGQWAGHKCMRNADPLYEKPADMDPDDARICFAKDGYVVGGIIVNNQQSGADGIQVIFMKKDGKTLDPNTSYKSRWYGYTDAGTRTQLAGDGKLVIGTFGRQGMNLDAFGLVIQSTDATNAPAGN